MKKTILKTTTTLLFALGMQVNISAQMKFMGTATTGGDYNSGTIYTVDSDGNSEMINSFYRGAQRPVYNSFKLWPNGNLVVPCQDGGIDGNGLLIEYDINKDTVYDLVDMTTTNGGSLPYGNLLLASNGNYYGTSYYGGVYQYDSSSKSCTKLSSITVGTGSRPYGTPIEIEPDVLLFVTAYGGDNAVGAIVKFDLTTNIGTTLFSFADSIGKYPLQGLTLSSSGTIYGCTLYGGVNGVGTVFKFNYSTNSFTKIYDCTGAPNRDVLVEADNGNLLGVQTYGGTAGHGLIFEIDTTTSAVNIKNNFNSIINGANPYVGLTKVPGNKFYGVTYAGGANTLGSIYEYNYTNNTITVLHSFGSMQEGRQALSGLYFDVGTNTLYGMTKEGGANNMGVIYKYNLTSNLYSKLYDLVGSINGAVPSNSLFLSKNGKIYGTTYEGGRYDVGILYEVDLDTKTYTPLQNFNQTAADKNGSGPRGKLIEDANGLLYGTAWTGGPSNLGTIFTYDPVNDTLTRIFAFTNAVNEGQTPFGGLAWNADSTLLYGITYQGGVNGNGTIYSFNPISNAFNKLHDMNAVTDGRNCEDNLTLAKNGKFYGATVYGGANNNGTIFSFDPSGNTFSTVHDFNVAVNGGNCENALIEGRGGNLYTTVRNGSGGAIVSYNYLTGTYSRLVYNSPTNGHSPYGNVLLSADSNYLFGTYETNWDSANGQIYRYDIANNSISLYYQFTGPEGLKTRADLIVAGCAKPEFTVQQQDTLICEGGNITLAMSGIGANN